MSRLFVLLSLLGTSCGSDVHVMDSPASTGSDGDGVGDETSNSSTCVETIEEATGFSFGTEMTYKGCEYEGPTVYTGSGVQILELCAGTFHATWDYTPSDRGDLPCDWGWFADEDADPTLYGGEIIDWNQDAYELNNEELGSFIMVLDIPKEYRERYTEGGVVKRRKVVFSGYVVDAMRITTYVHL